MTEITSGAMGGNLVMEPITEDTISIGDTFRICGWSSSFAAKAAMLETGTPI